MAKLTAEQAADVTAVQHTIYDWAYDLDQNEGVNIPGLITDDCHYVVRGGARVGPAAVGEFYTGRLAELSASDAGAPVQRHVLSNLRVWLKGADEASVTFLLVYFAAPGPVPIIGKTLPVAVADVEMDCRRGADGDWKISRFDSSQPFRAM